MRKRMTAILFVAGLTAFSLTAFADEKDDRIQELEEQIVEMQQRLDASDMSLDATVGDESGSATRMDFLPALGPGIEESLAGMEIAELLQSKIRDILPSLSEKEAYILVQIRLKKERRAETLALLQQTWEKINPNVPFEYQDIYEEFMLSNRKTIELAHLLIKIGRAHV